jgi:predicted MFS family arabinose efflux permease
MDQSALYVTGIEEVLWGTMLLAITMALHGLGMLFTLRVISSVKDRFAQPPGLTVAIGLLILASWFIAFTHLLEVLAWALFFIWKHALPNPSVAYYFALLEYTTVGSDYHLPFNWRLLEGMIAIAGLLTFAWSTGVLYTLAKEFQDQQLLRVQQRRRHRG